MKLTNRKIGTKKSFGKIIIPTLTMPIFYIIFTFAACVICYSGNDPTASVNIASLAALLATGGAGSFFVSKITGNGSILLPMTSSFGFALLFIAVNLIANGKASYACLMNALCFILVSLLFAFLAKITKQKHKRRRFK